MSCPHCNPHNLTASCFFCRPSPPYHISCEHGNGAYCCDKCQYDAMRNAYVSDNTDAYEKAAQGAKDYKEDRISKREWRFKSLWQKIKRLLK